MRNADFGMGNDMEPPRVGCYNRDGSSDRLQNAGFVGGPILCETGTV